MSVMKHAYIFLSAFIEKYFIYVNFINVSDAISLFTFALQD